MKNFYPLFSLIITAAVQPCGAQLTAQTADCSAMEPVPGRPGLVEYERAVPFWTEDFGSGFPAGWAIIDSSGLCPWTYTTDGSWGYWNGNSATAAATGISSATAANGYMICDNDSANHFTYGQPSGTTYQYLSSWMGTTAIDCSANTSVILRFQQYFRYNNSVDLTVQVSNDSVVWTSYDVSGGVANNTFSSNPDDVILNISPVAAGQSTVYLRFGWNARVYFWIIDDISLSEADPNDVAMDNGYWEAGTFGYQHFKIPLGQASPLTFFGALTNMTAATLNDVYFDVDLDDGGGSVFSGTSALLDIASTITDTTSVAATWAPTATGTFAANYTGAVTAAVDGDLTNNNFTDTFEVTSSVYGLDNLTDPAFSSGSISNWSGNTGLQFGIGNLYEVINDDEIQCVEIGIANDTTNAGEPIFASVYFWDGSGWAFLDQTDDYIVGAADIGSIVTINFDNPVAVTSGQEIVVTASHYGGGDCSFMFAQSVRNQMVYGYDDSFTWYWLSSPRALVVRANFDCGLGFEEADFTDLTVYPNPSSGLLNASLDLTGVSDIGIMVCDLSGKVVKSYSETDIQAGHHVLQMDLSAVSSGQYMVEFSVNGTIQREKINVR